MAFIQSFKAAFQCIFKYKGLLIILFIGPIFLTLLFGGVYSNDYVNDMPIAILDEDASNLSQYVANTFSVSDRFEIAYYPNSRAEMQKLMDDGTIAMGIWIPKDFERSVTAFQSAEIIAIIDGSNNVVAGNAYAQATAIIQTISAGVEMKLIAAKGMSNAMAKNTALVYNVSERILFDPKMTYMNYLMICFFAVFIQQLMMSAMGGIFNRERETLLKGNVLINLIATTSACIVGMTPALIISMVLLKNLFHIPIIGNLWTASLMTLIFMFSLTGPASVLSGLTRDRVKFAQISFMLSVPTLVTSGCVWPLEEMPNMLKIVVQLFWPLIQFAKPLQEVLIKGRAFETVRPQVLSLVVFTIVWTLIGWQVYKRDTISPQNNI
ncbi:ABC transporter permease [Fusibacter ferrireducens]|uniref:ABC transporter permease n=1 Tax=Fusibacter ferrireducens TaxID=2785058 RepID=A0ABR9ZYZ8_9FIRM|nr:ABC transporter permease [Fusibacter ferrireducens]MBF4695115.1 ABC transporter permease [Fusibacter ferrireducens]